MKLSDIPYRLSRVLPGERMLSDHFSASELACSHCGRVYVVPPLLVMMETLRSLVNVPLYLDPKHGYGSGYRCPTHNRNIGGASKSKHCLGMAVDIPVPARFKDNPAEFIEAAEMVAKEVRGGFHYYPGSHFIHIDCWVWPPDRRW